MLFQSLCIPWTVQKECSSVNQLLYHVVLVNIGRVMTCYKVCLMDQVCRLDRLLTKAEVRHCNTTGFLWVIIKVSLCIHICIITDDLDWVLVRTYCSVSSKSPEFTVDRSFRCCDQWLIGFQWQMRYIIIDTDRKFSFCIIVIYSNDLCRCCIFGT